MAGSHLSRDFFDLVKNIGEAKSKQVCFFFTTRPYFPTILTFRLFWKNIVCRAHQEEDQIISNEVGKLQQLMGTTGILPVRSFLS
jgi:hypothetical protein